MLAPESTFDTLTIMAKEEAPHFEGIDNEELIRRRTVALGAIAEITAHLDDGENMSQSSREELEESRELFHGDVEAYWVELTKRGFSE